MKITKLLLLAGALVLSFSACHHAGNTQNETYAYTDDYGTTQQVPTHPQRIVSTSPAVTEIIYAIGAQDQLVARTEFCQYPAEAKKLPSIGYITNLNVERILSFQPDLVISGSMVPQKSVQQLQQMNVPMACVVEKKTFDGLYENISKIGQLTDHKEAAESLIAQLKTRVSTLEKPTTTKSVYYVVGFGQSGNFTAGGNTFINDIITMAGGHNIAADIDGWSYSLEQLMKQDPDYIVIRAEDSAAFCSTAPYTKLSAVKEGRVVAIESGMIDLQVPRNIDAILYLAKRFKI